MKGKTSASLSEGRITQVIGPVVDVYFEKTIPEIYDSLEVDNGLILEVQQVLGGNEVRSVAMGSTDGLRRGQKVL